MIPSKQKLVLVLERITIMFTLMSDEPVNAYLHYTQNHTRNCIIGHLDINSTRNKFDAVECILNEGLLDVFAIS